MAAGLQSRLEELDGENRERFDALVREGARPYFDGQRLRLPAMDVCASGRA
jgi:hypothetical protein